MKIFNMNYMRDHVDQLIQEAEAGRLSIVTNDGKPLFVAVPFDESVLRVGVYVALAVELFAGRQITLVQAAHLAGVSASEMIDILAEKKIPVVDYSGEELIEESKQHNLNH